MRDAFIVSAMRTAVGKAPNGALRSTRPDDLGAIAVRGALDRVPELDVKQIEDVIIGCAMPEAEQGLNSRSCSRYLFRLRKRSRRARQSLPAECS